MNTSKLHLEILDQERKALLKNLSSLEILNNFVLSGGTALALQVNHRLSYDFDFFSSNQISTRLLENLKNSLNINTISIDTPDELTFFTQKNIKLTFLHYPFKRLLPLNKSADLNFKLYKVKEISAQKAYTIGRRGDYKDYYDLFWILKNEYTSISEVLDLCEKIYGSIFSEKLFLEQLVYFDDLDNFEIIPTKNSTFYEPEVVKNFLKKKVKEHLS